MKMSNKAGRSFYFIFGVIFTIYAVIVSLASISTGSFFCWT